MVNKLMLLLPLLGWFYLSILGFVILYYVFPRLRKVTTFVYYTGFSIFAFTVMYASIPLLKPVFIDARKSNSRTVEEKISEQAGSSYKTYFKGFRPEVLKRNIYHVQFLHPSTKEFLYAKMYLYPAGVEDVSQIRNNKGELAIIGESEIKQYWDAKVLSIVDGRALVELGAIRD